MKFETALQLEREVRDLQNALNLKLDECAKAGVRVEMEVTDRAHTLGVPSCDKLLCKVLVRPSQIDLLPNE